jgi:hypothetical protein
MLVLGSAYATSNRTDDKPERQACNNLSVSNRKLARLERVLASGDLESFDRLRPSLFLDSLNGNISMVGFAHWYKATCANTFYRATWVWLAWCFIRLVGLYLGLNRHPRCPGLDADLDLPFQFCNVQCAMCNVQCAILFANCFPCSHWRQP